MSEQTASVVTRLPVPRFLMELHSERMIDAINALQGAGFVVKLVKCFENRYRIDDAQEQTE
jgi:hypothetical protein